MRKVIFESIEAENFCNFDEMAYPIDGQKLTSISGPNGIGKTTCLDAIPFALYGITSKGLKTEQVINNKVGRNCKVSLKFKVDNEEYEVVRFVKYSRFGTTVYLKKGKEVIKKGQNEVKPAIEKLLISQKLFFNTLLFGQKVKTFFTQLVDSEQKIIFRNILSLEKYEDYRKETTEKIRDKNNSLTKYNNELEVNSSLLEEIISEISYLIESKKNFENEKEVKIDIIKEEDKNIDNEIINLKKNISKDSNFEDSLNEVKEEINKTNSEFENISSSIEKIVVDIENKAENKKSDLLSKAKDAKYKEEEIFNTSTSDAKDKHFKKTKEVIDQINKLEKDLEVTNVEVKVLSSNLNKLLGEKEETQKVIKNENSVCPTCGHKIEDEKTIEIFKDKLDVLDKEIINHGEEIESLEMHIQGCEIQIVQEKIFLEGLEKDFNEYIKEITDERHRKNLEIDIKLKSAFEKVDNLRSKEISEKTSEFESSRKELDNKLKELNLKKNEIEYNIEENNKIEKLITSLENKKEVLSEKLKLVESTEFDSSEIDNKKIKEKSLKSKNSSLIERISSLKEELEILDFWRVAFSSAGIPSMLIDEAIPFMNKRVSYYLDKLSAGRYTVSFDTMKEIGSGEFRDKININVIDNLTKANTRDQLSGGQTRLVDIASILTLYDLQCFVQDISFNMMIFDEIFDSLDDENIRYASNVLKELVGDEKSIFLITHRHIDQLDADNELNFWS